LLSLGNPQEIEFIFTHLVSSRLLSAGAEGHQTFVEISHEALIREWSTLREWIAQNREEIRLERRLIQAAEEWQRVSHDPGALLQGARNPARALAYYRAALALYDRDSRLFIGAADAALALRQPALADTLLRRAAALCGRCAANYQNQASGARARGDSSIADSLLARAGRLASP